jgi:hypothetical protein
MFPVSEVAPNAMLAGQTQSRQHVIASVIAQQRVIAGQAAAESGDAAARNFSSNDEREKAVRNAERVKQRAANIPPHPTAGVSVDRSAEARSIVEAQEASTTERKIVAAFQARHGLLDLLSVIRDPEDRMLPQSPKE